MIHTESALIHLGDPLEFEREAGFLGSLLIFDLVNRQSEDSLQSLNKI